MFETDTGMDLRDSEVKRANDWESVKVTEPADAGDVHELDSDDMLEKHRRLMSYYKIELDRQQDNRIQAAIDEDFYDNVQWSEEDAQALRERGQAPLVYNVIKQSVNWVIGSEKRGRTDFKVLPRGKEDAKPAERKTDLLKYLSDVNRTPFHRSRAFEDSVKTGLGWVEDGAQDDDEGEVVYSRYESWRNMLWDSASTEMDLSDCRYVIRSKWIDMDIAIAMFPEREQLIKESAQDDEDIGLDFEHGDEPMDASEAERDVYGVGRQLEGYDRRRVRIIEMWYRAPERADKIIGSQFSGEVFEPGQPGHEEAIATGQAVVESRMHMKMRVGIMTTKGMLYEGKSPYRHNTFPFTPIWGYRRGRNNLPYGMVRDLRDIQADINKRASKSLFILSSNKVVMDSDAVEDLEEFRREAARPDGILVKKAGKELVLNADRDLAPAHLDLMSRGIQMIQQVGGVTDEQMGRSTNATSGRAIEARQEQGALSTATFFDNLRFANQIQGEKELSLVEQFFTDQKTFRITNERGSPTFVDVNDGLPEHDITRSKADFIISEGEWRASLRQAQAEQLMEMMTRMPPEVAMVMLDLVVESMDLPNREEIVNRIRAINGQSDPDATEMTEEEAQRKEAQAQQQQLQQEMVMADLRKKLAEAGKTEAEAQQIAGEMVASQYEQVGDIMDARTKALETAREAIMTPGAAQIADRLMQDAGYVSPQQRAQAQQAQQRRAQMQQEAQQNIAAREQQAAQEQQQGEEGQPPPSPQQGGMPQRPQPPQQR